MGGGGIGKFSRVGAQGCVGSGQGGVLLNHVGGWDPRDHVKLRQGSTVVDGEGESGGGGGGGPRVGPACPSHHQSY